jgi:PAS domain S-box-containing protein
MKDKFGWKQIINIFKRPGFWLIFILLVIITVTHYREAIILPGFLHDVVLQTGLDRHAFERVFYLLPIVLAGFIFGWRGTVITSLIALVCMLPRVFILSDHFIDSLFETFSVFVVGNVVAITFISLRKEREHRVRLAVIDKIATAVSQSLDLSQVLNASVDSVMSVMNIDAALIFLVDEDAGVLTLDCYRGVSEKFVLGVDKLKMGEGMNGAVALSGEAEYIEDAMADPRVTKIEAVKLENLRSHFIVPLKSKGKVMGTLAIATRDKYQFKNEEKETALAIGNEIGVAIDNARVYEQVKRVAEQLRISEEKYRNLFENAHDAIWLHDLNDNIIAANKACSRLTGHSLIELYFLKASLLLSDDSLQVTNDMHRRLMDKEDSGQVSEVKLVRKDGNEVIVHLATSLVYKNNEPWAFQNIARDITQEKHMEENLRFYLHQVTQAQEEERKRIARELHDDTIQSLVVLARKIDDIYYDDKELSEDKRKLLEGIREETDNIMAGVRRLSQDLRPPILDRLGLKPALEDLSVNVQNISGITVKLTIKGKPRRLPTEVETTLYRIIQEGLRNIWRHSKATAAELLLEFQDSRTFINIRDNGKGLDFTYPPDDLARYGKLGLAGMKERARLLGGTLTIESKPMEGTLIKIDVPV